jgi:hypothetical protein
MRHATVTALLDAPQSDVFDYIADTGIRYIYYDVARGWSAEVAAVFDSSERTC